MTGPFVTPLEVEYVVAYSKKADFSIVWPGIVVASKERLRVTLAIAGRMYLIAHQDSL